MLYTMWESFYIKHFNLGSFCVKNTKTIRNTQVSIVLQVIKCPPSYLQKLKPHIQGERG